MVRVAGVRAAAAALAALLLIPACSRGPANAPAESTTSTPAAAAPGVEPAPSTLPPATSAPADGVTGPPTGPTPAPAAWRPCGQFQCATVAVPLDHARPDGPSITIALLRRPATGTRKGAIFVNPGGPGASGIDFARTFQLDATTATAYDLIGFDPRGVGASTPVRCDLKRAAAVQPDYSPDTPAEVAALDDEARSFARACAATDATLLPWLRTEQVAQDLDWLRQAVGEARLDYIGFSFGTLIGLLYAQQFPDRVHHLVLDGVVDPTQSLPELLTGQAVAFEHAFEVLDRACGSGLSCPPGGAAAGHDQLMARLERDGPLGPVGPAELDDATILALYDRSLWPVYTAALSAALGGQPAQMKRLSDAYATTVPFGAYAGVECTDGPRPTDPAGWDRFAAELEAKAPRFGAPVANELRTCAWWPAGPGPDRPPVTAAGAPPILVVGNTNDPATPLANAQAVASHLAQARLLVATEDGHTAYSTNACVRQAVQRYFADGTLPAPGARC